jgi:PqqD family protein of HPr-rel-A system
LDDDLVLYDDRDGCSYVLNRTGAAVWELCDGSLNLRQIASAIAGKYQIDPERARADVEALVSSLRRAGLVRSSC